MSTTTAPKIPTRRLGRSELNVSVVGAGCWAIGGPDFNLGLPMGWGGIDDHESIAALEASYAAGIFLFDTADVYGHGRSERLIGELVAQVDRTSIILTSKVGYFGGTAPHAYEPLNMRHQLEQSLENLRTDHLDIYFLHNANFGKDDRYLAGVLDSLATFRREGLIRSVGMRGPHRYALDRLAVDGSKEDKLGRFESLFHLVQPDVLAVRDNLLSPQRRGNDICAFADANDCGVLINKPLGQGLLTGSYLDNPEPQFVAGDHRQRKAWFQPPALRIIKEGLNQLQGLVGSDDRNELIRLAIWSCLDRTPRASVLCGFRNREQAVANAAAGLVAPKQALVSEARRIMSEVQRRLDAAGEVFLDEGVAR